MVRDYILSWEDRFSMFRGHFWTPKGHLLSPRGHFCWPGDHFELREVTFWARRCILRPFGIGSAHKSQIPRITHIKMISFVWFWCNFEVIWRAKDDQKEVQIRYQQSIEFWFRNLMIFHDFWSVCQVKNNQKPIVFKCFSAIRVFVKSWTLRPKQLDFWFPKWSKIESRGW